MIYIDKLVDKIVGGGQVSEEEAYALCNDVTSDSLRAAAQKVHKACAAPTFDSCSIINALSGRCPENCKWCAQSIHYSTGCEEYQFVGKEACIKAAEINYRHGVGRFSIVTSGRTKHGQEMAKICDALTEIRNKVGISTCASLGLLSREDLQMLWDAGVRRYHCNLETAPSMFAKLCSTHSIEDKLATIAIAQEIGFEICSGGIIGMGETKEQRVELALTLRKVAPVSIPINILCPIEGTPLESQPLISESDIIDTVAIFRLIHPRVQLRFAGGRQRISRESQIEAMRCGINGAIMGNMLTTLGPAMAQDKEMIAEAYRNA